MKKELNGTQKVSTTKPEYNILTPERALVKAGLSPPGISPELLIIMAPERVGVSYTLYTSNVYDSPLYFTPDSLMLGNPVTVKNTDEDITTLMRSTTMTINDFLTHGPHLFTEEQFTELFINLMADSCKEVVIDASLATLSNQVAGIDTPFVTTQYGTVTLDLSALKLGLPLVEYTPDVPDRPPMRQILPAAVLPRLWGVLAESIVEGNTRVMPWIISVIRNIDDNSDRNVMIVEQEQFRLDEEFQCTKVTGGWVHSVTVQQVRDTIAEAHLKLGLLEEKHRGSLIRDNKVAPKPKVNERVPIHVYPNGHTIDQVLTVTAGPDKGMSVKCLTQDNADMEYPLDGEDYEPGVYWVEGSGSNWRITSRSSTWDIHDKGDHTLITLAIGIMPSVLQDKLAEERVKQATKEKENERLRAEKEAAEEAARKAKADAQAESQKRKEAEQDKPWKYTKEFIGVLAGLVGIAATIYKLS